MNEKVSDYRNAGEGERWKFYGPSILYHRMEQKQEEGFKDGNSKMGLWKYYDENETVLKEEFYYTKDLRHLLNTFIQMENRNDLYYVSSFLYRRCPYLL
ncbi:MAG: hypothetical protein IPG07_05545 [Crocinitomicaceae bacterium]|nr:hypothetical protein [Crocinitomicaceae bacterium]